MVVRRVSTGIPELDTELKGGFPSSSTILIEGDSGLGKEVIAYKIASHLVGKDFSVAFLTTRQNHEVMEDAVGNGIYLDGVRFVHVTESASEESDVLNITNLGMFVTDLNAALKELGKAKRICLIGDFLSPLLLKQGLERVYGFLVDFLQGCKMHEGEFLFLLERGMHDNKELASIERLFDGVLQLSPSPDGVSLKPLVTVKKMIGLPPFRANYVELGLTQREGVQLIGSRKEIAQRLYELLSNCKEEFLLSTYGSEIGGGSIVFGPLMKGIVKNGGRVRLITNIESKTAEVFQEFLNDGIEVRNLDEERIRRFFVVDGRVGFFSVTKPDKESNHEKLEDYKGEDAWVSTNQPRQINALKQRFETDWTNSNDATGALNEFRRVLRKNVSYK